MPETPIVIIGGGIAGLSTALACAGTAGRSAPILVITAGPLGLGGSTEWAQGGIAAAVGDDDTPALHGEDTVAVGGGLTDPLVARHITGDAPAAISTLEHWGVVFDRKQDGRFSRGLEAGHSRRRVLHVHGDRSGLMILTALADRLRRTPSIQVLEHTTVVGLCGGPAGVTGVSLRRTGQDGSGSGSVETIAARAVILATGGLGGLYASTTNPLTSTGGGLILAARAGAELRDMEFVQFHPTALAVGADPMPLASEALRGEGARLIRADGTPLMAALSGGDLAPRDVVSQTVAAEIGRGGSVFLDAREALGARFADRFPTVYGHCRDHGLDPAVSPIPIRPATHYHMGGVAVDDHGRTTVPGLWACGEVSSTGLHGANRLASNSLIEAVVTGRRIASALAGSEAGRAATATAPAAPAAPAGLLSVGPRGAASTNPAAPRPLRDMMDRQVGVVRDAAGLSGARDSLIRMAEEAGGWPDAALAALLIVQAALERRESRGAHQRSDFPATAAKAVSSRLTLAALENRLALATPPLCGTHG